MLSAFDSIRKRHPDALQLWAEFMGGWTRFNVVCPEGLTTYSQIDGQMIYTNDRTKTRHFIFRG